MLRSLKSPHLNSLLQGWVFATTGAAVVDRIGAEEGTTARTGTGKVTITPDVAGSREGVVLATPQAAVPSDGGFCTFDTAHSGTVATVEIHQQDGTAIDTKGASVLTLGFESDETDRLPLGNYQTVRNSRIAPRLMGFRVASAGTLGLGKSQASVSVASSVYTLEFERAFQRDPSIAATIGCVVLASPIAATRKSLAVETYAANSVSVAAYDPVGGAAEDNDFYCLVLGWDCPSIAGGAHRVVEVPQLKPRMECFRVDGNGTAAIDMGSTDATLKDNSTGNYTLTWTEAFAREPVVIVTGKTQPAQLLAAATKTSCQFGAFDASTNLAADDEIYVMVLGYDNDTEV